MPKDDEDIRRQDSARIPFFIVEKQVASNVHVVAPLKVRAQCINGIDEGSELKVAFCHGETVRIWVMDLSCGRCYGESHRKIPQHHRGL